MQRLVGEDEQMATQWDLAVAMRWWLIRRWAMRRYSRPSAVKFDSEGRLPDRCVQVDSGQNTMNVVKLWKRKREKKEKEENWGERRRELRECEELPLSSFWQGKGQRKREKEKEKEKEKKKERKGQGRWDWDMFQRMIEPFQI